MAVEPRDQLCGVRPIRMWFASPQPDSRRSAAELSSWRDAKQAKPKTLAGPAG